MTEFSLSPLTDIFSVVKKYIHGLKERKNAVDMTSQCTGAFNATNHDGTSLVNA
jgi:hypothetical protein